MQMCLQSLTWNHQSAPQSMYTAHLNLKRYMSKIGLLIKIICIGVFWVHYPPVNSYTSKLWRRTKRRFMYLSQLSLSPHGWLSIWQQKAADIVGHVSNRQPETLIQPKPLLLVSVILPTGIIWDNRLSRREFLYQIIVDSIWNDQWWFPTCLHV